MGIERKLWVREAYALLGVSESTVRDYTRRGLLECDRTPGGQRVFTHKQLKDFLGEGVEDALPQRFLFYVRSSSGDKKLMDSQVAELIEKYGTPTKVYKDSSPGLNESRKDLNPLLNDVAAGEIDVIYTTTPDRLTSFGHEYLNRIFDNYGTEHISLSETKPSPKEELLQDFMSLLASFSGKYYRMRSKKSAKDLLQKAEKSL